MLFRSRRRALVRALDRELGGLVEVVGDHAGMHLVATLHADDREIALRAVARGLSVIPLSSCYAGRARRRGLLLGYGAMRAGEIGERVRELADAIRGKPAHA